MERVQRGGVQRPDWFPFARRNGRCAVVLLTAMVLGVVVMGVEWDGREGGVSQAKRREGECVTSSGGGFMRNGCGAVEGSQGAQRGVYSHSVGVLGRGGVSLAHRPVVCIAPPPSPISLVEHLFPSPHRSPLS